MHTPRKRFGQHFLCDQAVIHQIVNAIAPKSQDHLIEIGPGQGAITIPILKQVKFLEAVELDRDLLQELQGRANHVGNLKIYAADALTFDFAQIKNDARPLRIFGNLPYNISTPLIFHLLEFVNIIEDMTFMLQKEVAERLAATCDSDHYGRLSVMIQYHCDVNLLFNVPPSAFFPPPQVMSSIVKIRPKKTISTEAHDYQLFAKVVQQAFNQRRKTLRNSLRNMISNEVWATLSIRSDLRAENISVDQFVLLSNAISSSTQGSL